MIIMISIIHTMIMVMIIMFSMFFSRKSFFHIQSVVAIKHCMAHANVFREFYVSKLPSQHNQKKFIPESLKVFFNNQTASSYLSTVSIIHITTFRFFGFFEILGERSISVNVLKVASDRFVQHILRYKVKDYHLVTTLTKLDY